MKTIGLTSQYYELLDTFTKENWMTDQQSGIFDTIAKDFLIDDSVILNN